MKVFFDTYKPQLFYALIVLVTLIALLVFTKILHQWLVKKKEQKFPGENNKTLNLLKRLLNSLWLVLGIIAFSFLFVEKDEYNILQSNFRLIMYLGFIAILTIVSASTINLWFKNKIKVKVTIGDDPTAYKFLRYVVVVSICFVGIVFGLLVFPSLRSVAQTALGGAGVVAIIIGVASQEALANLVGGIFIISFKPFKIGDIIKISDTMVGTVTDITLRHTVMRNFENKMIVIPNAVINKEKLINYDLGESKCCDRIEIGISYDSDVTLAKKIMQKECENHPLIIDNRSEVQKQDGQPIVKIALTALNDSSVTIRAWAWSKDYVDSFDLRCDILESVKKQFEMNGIEIPYPYRTLVMKQESVKDPLADKPKN
ncbi:mechanosensitive ion channel family protein [Putridiphycobacter roseus]|uniref:Mechanosensitive ion channel family protein n=1 Tax=Putridiphycobacter roseus TaxID=2219161 RepID=A0A2W1N575_9FLAO|nr:mechanosensitive ion channel family protein [Putridiphycobacter roseus]PZE18750.1 mechanosensitive ion channel family protein [Putridiphycobacter roseus]